MDYESLNQFSEKDLRLQSQIDAVRNHHLQTNELQQYVHLVFSLSDAGSLKVTLSKVSRRNQYQVLAFNEWFSVGPISNLDTVTGQQNRLFWLMEYDGDFRYGQHSNQ